MRLTTLCYLEKDGCYLMLHRTKKKNDGSLGKWIGVGGKMEAGESPEECALREIWEETGLQARHLELRSVITFISDQWEDEMMYLFSSRDFAGELKECDEGELAWIPVEDVEALPSWEGDRIFLRRLRQNEDFYTLKLVYEGEDLRQAILWEKGEKAVLKG